MKSNICLFCVVILSLGLLSCSSGKNILTVNNRVVLQPDSREGIDAFIESWPYENYSNTNWGDYEAFVAIAWTAGGTPMTARSLMKFDLKAIPSGSKVKRATLSLYSTGLPYIGEGHSDLSGPNDFVINRVISKWDERTVTWNTQPRITREGEIILPPSGSYDQDYIDIDITEMVQAMVRKPSENHGIMIRLLNESYYRGIIFASSDHSDPEKRPRLVIDL